MRPALSLGDDMLVKLICILPDTTTWQDSFPTLENTKEQVLCQQAEESKEGHESRKAVFESTRLLIDRLSLRTAAMTTPQTLKMVNFPAVFSHTLECNYSPSRVSHLNASGRGPTHSPRRR